MSGRTTRPAARSLRRAGRASVGWWRRSAGPLRQPALAVGIALVAYLACFPIARPVTLDVGRFPDRLVIAGFNGDERDNGITYRWTRTMATVAIPGYGGVRDAHIEIDARNGRGTPTEIPFQVDLGASPAPVAASGAFLPVLADLRASGTGADLTVRLRAERFIPASSDTRILGVQIDRLRIEPLETSWWAGAVGGWPWAVRLMLFALAITLVVPRAWSGRLGGGLAALVAFAALAAPETRFVFPPLLVPAIIAVSVGGAALRWRASAALLSRGWHALDQRSVARGIVAVLVAGYVAVTFVVVCKVDFIGHADYADNAVRARNLVRLKGDVIDYVPQFYTRFGSITHPAETWPPLQVWLIAVAFRLFGISTVVAKLPNIAIMAGLLGATYAIGAWRWSRRVGVLAAVFLAAMPLVFEDTLFPVNDLVFTLLFAAFVVALYRAWYEPRVREPSARPGRMGRWLPDIALGAAAGLFLLAKPSGGVMIAGAAFVAFVAARRAWTRIPWSSIAVALVTMIACYMPWAVRNIVTFHTPFHSTESYDAWVLKYDPAQPVDGIYGVFWNKALPHPRLLVGYGYDHFLTVQGQQFTRLWGDLTGGALIPRVLLPLLVIGLIIGAARRPGFGLVLLGAVVPYLLFVCLYWHEEVRYLLVLVPWLLLYAAAGLEWTYDALITWFAGMRQRALVPLLVGVLLAAIFIPAGRDIRVRVAAQTSGNGMVEAANWLKANTPADAVVMTRNPWEISWHSGRRAVMLPLGTRDEVYAVMRQYHVTVLELDHINDPNTIRESLKSLYSFKDVPGITPLYDPQNNFYLVFAVSPPPA